MSIDIVKRLKNNDIQEKLCNGNSRQNLDFIYALKIKIINDPRTFMRSLADKLKVDNDVIITILNNDEVLRFLSLASLNEGM